MACLIDSSGNYYVPKERHTKQKGELMKIKSSESNHLLLIFTDEEIEYFKDEAARNNISVEEMILVMFGTLMIGGYSLITGKEDS